MKTPKFKVGDRVRILDGDNIPDYTGSYTFGMRIHIGEEVTIGEIENYPNGRIGYQMKENFYTWDERGLELVSSKNDTIVIYRKNNQVIALDKSTGKKAIARCNPVDTFDFYYGARLAFDRLIGDKREDPDKTPLNAKIVFTKGDHVFKTGHIYEIKDGKITDPRNGGFLPLRTDHLFYSIEDVKYYFSKIEDRTLPDNKGWSINGLEFIEVKED